MDFSGSLSGSAVQWGSFWIGGDLLGREDPKVPTRRDENVQLGDGCVPDPWVLLGSGFLFLPPLPGLEFPELFLPAFPHCPLLESVMLTTSSDSSSVFPASLFLNHPPFICISGLKSFPKRSQAFEGSVFSLALPEHAVPG